LKDPSSGPSEVIFGRNPVAEALKSEAPVKKVLLARGMPYAPITQEIEKLAASASIPIVVEDRRRLSAIAGHQEHQGVVAIVAPFIYTDFNTLAEAQTARLILLDGVTDPQNLGSLLRSAEAFGWTGVIVPKRRSVGVTPTVRKVAAGAAERVPVAQAGSAADTVLRLSKKGVFVAGLDPDGDIDYRDLKVGEPGLCLVLGAEGKGLSRLVRERCDATVRIPMSGHQASINVAVAGAIFMARFPGGPRPI
jgi:23S rRNA (guanosine2251-2'-O)-methyltransferase